MRPVRLVVAITSCLFTVLLLSFFAAKRSAHATAGHDGGRYRALFDWHSPSSLFPPSAIISLTDDNSTFFLARPANFGPTLPGDGLSGQLWIGSGFGDEDFARGGVASNGGEMGCSDVPGWTEGDHRGNPGRTSDSGDKSGKTATSDMKEAEMKTPAVKRRTDMSTDAPSDAPSEEDGTDDHLHHPLPFSEDPNAKSADGKKQGHADIQSLQESAEIAGKVVLLKRGGCGFLEKVKWAQRRGGTALIVGDNIRGGPLVTMYARGDTSNVTIPSLFTSHTTAHLLSSLMPPGGFLDDISPEDARRLGLALNGDSKAQPKPDTKPPGGQSKGDMRSENIVSTKSLKASEESEADDDDSGWFSSLFSGSGGPLSRHDSHRPPSSGSVGWVLQEDFDSAEDGASKQKEKSASPKGTNSAKQGTKNAKTASDGFVIGVQDWRDPDLVDTKGSEKTDDSKSTTTKSNDEQPTNQASPRGGSITPGSGEYGKQSAPKKQPAGNSKDLKSTNAGKTTQDARNSGWLRKFSSSDKEDRAKDVTSHPGRVKQAPASTGGEKGKDDKQDPQIAKSKQHDGLWVTLQPTTMSSSPFFDTLLVLVVSPLVTLTVVYALLLLRSRIRRRRWRAPKSVVERLPVRTYHTIASSTATTSSAQTSAPGTPPSPTSTTPLLHSSARPIGQRPRSRTTGEVPVASSSYANHTPNLSSLDQIQEKREAGLTEWKRKYGGKQRECVVCLEEYVDGVSRVMSLPCGHEFHADCITPWLTTRRRTCPICKGDVVRSLARSTGNNSSATSNENRYDSYEEDDDELVDGIQQQAIASRNDDPAAAAPMSRDDEAFEDLERGVVPDRNR